MSEPDLRAEVGDDITCNTDDPTSPLALSDELSGAAQTPEQQAEARRYGQMNLYCDLADRAIDLTFLSLMAFYAAGPISNLLQGFGWITDRPVLQVALMFLMTIALHALVSFPLTFYSGYALEHRFDLSHLTVGGWISRYAKRLSLSTAFGLLMFIGLYAVIWHVGPLWWLVAAAATFVVSIVLGQLAPVLIMPLFYRIEPIENDELRMRMERLAAGTGLSIAGIYRLVLSEETSKANAMLAGLGRTRRVLMGDTVLDNFTPEEIDVIFAHEIGHHVHRHITKLIALGVVLCTVGFWLCDRVLVAYLATYSPGSSYAELPASTVPLIMLLITLFSQFSEPLQNLISRHFERQSDRYALESTNLKSAYLSAFRKLARLNKDDPSPHPLEVILFHSHPPIRERLAVGEAFEEQNLSTHVDK